jgi:hypothetical protein
MSDRPLRAVVALGALVFLAGCSGSHSGVAAGAKTGVNGSAQTTGHGGAAARALNQTQVQTAAGVSTAAGPSTANGGASAPRGGGTTGGASQAGAQSPTPRATEIPLHASLSKTCVTVGQTLTLTLHAEPHMSVIFDARYPDGKDGQVHGGFDSRGSTNPATGDYTSTWTVGPGTPSGAADVELAAIGSTDYHTGHQRLPFTVALTCP